MVRNYTLMLVTIFLVCLTIIFVYTSVILWPYRQLLAIAVFVSLLGSFLVWVWVTARASLVEQVLRLERIRYKEEMPLDYNGQTQYMPQEYQKQSRVSRAYFPVDEQ